MNKPLSYKLKNPASMGLPILLGYTFCSPGCGAGCTAKGFDLAMANAQELAVTLGDGWEPCLWEATGWHWGAELGDLRVFPNDPHNPTLYTATMDAVHLLSYIDEDPKEAARRVISEISTLAYKLLLTVSKYDAITKGKTLGELATELYSNGEQCSCYLSINEPSDMTGHKPDCIINKKAHALFNLQGMASDMESYNGLEG